MVDMLGSGNFHVQNFVALESVVLQILPAL